MRARSVSAVLVAAIAVAAPVIADARNDAEPVLRLRLSDPLLDTAPKPFLRPRLSENVTGKTPSVPMPSVTLEDAGHVGKFAYLSTPHPNLVVAIGATEDRSELGRQIDRAIMDMTPENRLYQTDRDRMPFLGLGVRTGRRDRGWTMDATVGAGLMNRAESARLTDWTYGEAIDSVETEARANVRLRYRF